MVWEALDPWCQNRQKVTERRRNVVQTAGINVLVWVLNGPANRQVSMDVEHEMIRTEIENGGVVVVHCINAHHRSVASLTSFLVRELNMTVAQAAAIMWQHPWQKLLEIRDDQL